MLLAVHHLFRLSFATLTWAVDYWFLISPLLYNHYLTQWPDSREFKSDGWKSRFAEVQNNYSIGWMAVEWIYPFDFDFDMNERERKIDLRSFRSCENSGILHSIFHSNAHQQFQLLFWVIFFYVICIKPWNLI